MSVELLSYADLGTRLQISREAARSLARRRRLPRSRSDQGEALVSVDVAELRHMPRPRIGRQGGRQADHIAASIAEIEALKTAALETAASEIEACKAEIARLEAATVGYRADFERERERADRLATELQQAAAETTAVNERAARLAIETLEIEACKAEIARLEAAAAGYRVVFERERERADHLAAELLQASAEATAANELAARLEDEVAALRTGRADGAIAGQAAARRLGHLAAAIIGADRAARK